MRKIWLWLAALLVVTTSTQAPAEPTHGAPFTRTLSNTTPLVFGMSATEAAAALGVPLTYISGRPGNELLAADRPSAVNFATDAKLFLQFRKGRLSGWKGDWERNWMWK